ncbi:Uncharacterized conserved protein, DUF983 family [Robiginitalea myxolifaciens]|uniref:Uncharacterized conserved protein, DUF983 family n=1 Tax=Robiginitalea myxolifaciens TaxID=400055 RepID=A0A1I6G430_9FLAO|nr:DUF983 domain-containing protein [Robiginitalea myxolifaciens]SFR36922.1 Uncharacterized conserved protein, DUF983 family [Robiginitalea myxolifaciens]
MLGKGSKLYSILRLKCPQCHQGAFLQGHPYNLSKINRVRNSCPNCGLKYKIEPSFYYGSMYVSYGVGVAVGIAVFVLIRIFGLELSTGETFAAIVAALVLLMPWIGAVSKVIWANFFFKYDPSTSKSIKR